MNSKAACKNCEYMWRYRKLGNVQYEYFCKHPDRESINRYYKEKDILSMPGFLGRAKEGFPRKKTPPWCPMLQEKEGAETT